MGGLGSGSWLRFGKKNTVEESLTLRMSRFRDRLKEPSAGWIRWASRSGRESKIEFDIVPDDESPTITLSYRWRGQEDVQLPIRLQATPVHFGGLRWWFSCPLVTKGKTCNRRVASLHLPPSSRYFGCRSCHKLTYFSSQTAHQFERLLAQLGRWEVGGGSVNRPR